MKMILIAVCLLSAAIAKPTLVSDAPKDGESNIALFVEGFLLGSFNHSIEHITYCINDSVGLGETIYQDFQKMRNSSRIEKAYVITTLLFHMVQDIPFLISNCSQVKNDTQKIIEIFHLIFRPHQFSEILGNMMKNLGPVIKDIYLAERDIANHEWYEAGKRIGYVFAIVIENIDPESRALL